VRLIKRGGEETWESQGRPTLHGSHPQREMAKHGGQSMRWADFGHGLGRNRGNDADQPRPRHSGERP
jgi:hypothetical protein